VHIAATRAQQAKAGIAEDVQVAVQIVVETQAHLQRHLLLAEEFAHRVRNAPVVQHALDPIRTLA